MTCSVFAILFFVPNRNGLAQIVQKFELNYAGVRLQGQVDIEVKIVDSDRAAINNPLFFSNNKIKANVSKYKKPALVVEFSNLEFEAPARLKRRLSLEINSPSSPKGFEHKAQPLYQPFKTGEQRNYTYEISPADTVLTGAMKFTFTALVIDGKRYKLKNNELQLLLNIIPPPVFPEDASDDELWNIATKLNSVNAYKTYIERFPDGKSVRKARTFQRELIANPPTVSQPSLITTQEPVILKNEQREWRKIKNTNRIDAFNEYIKSFPKGDHAEEAQQAIRSISDSLNAHIRRSTESEVMGRLVYHIEDTMIVGLTYRVRLEISADTTSHFIEKLIATVEEFSEQPEELTTEIIQIGKTMRAKLEESSQEGNRNFHIHLFGESNEREVDLYSDKSTVWEWNVTPLKTGRHPLHFTIEIVTIKNGVEKQAVLPVYDSEVTILSRSLFETYKIQFIAGGIIGLLLIVVMWLVFKKKKTVDAQNDLDQLVKTNPLEGAVALIEEDKVREALNVLDLYFKTNDPEAVQEIILLKSRLSNISNNLRKATISKEAASTEMNSIKLAALHLIERVENRG